MPDPTSAAPAAPAAAPATAPAAPLPGAGGPSGEVTDPSQVATPPITPPAGGEEDDEPGKPLPKGVQRRIDRAVRDRYRAEAEARAERDARIRLETELAAVRNQTPQPSGRPASQQAEEEAILRMPGAPQMKDFDSFESYVAAAASFITDARIAAREREAQERTTKETQTRTARELQTRWVAALEKTMAVVPDLLDTLEESTAPINEAMQRELMYMDRGPEVAYYLAKNPAEAIKIANLDPRGVIRELGRIEDKLAAKPTPTPTSAPTPPVTGGGRAAPEADPDKMSMDEWLRWRNKQLTEQGRR